MLCVANLVSGDNRIARWRQWLLRIARLFRTGHEELAGDSSRGWQHPTRHLPGLKTRLSSDMVDFNRFRQI